jgi:basic membrane lipoprotein Med (substrate-binding protein (PBP1-ABC) superfamily)
MMKSDREKTRTRSGSLSAALCAVVLVIALIIAGGAQGSRDASTAANADKTLKVAWLLYGPKNDGGWNLAQTTAQAPAARMFGSSIQQQTTDNMPYSDLSTQITQRYVDSGANVLIDTFSMADLFYKVCKKSPEVICIETGPTGAVPANTFGWWVSYWIPAYTAGVTAGLLTKSNTAGYVSPYDIPLVKGSINSFTLGCRSVNPKCQVRVVTVNDYFNPPKTAQAANSLVDAGADVLRGYTDDPSYCAVAEQRHVFAIPEFWDSTAQCRNWVATSTIWNFKDLYLNQFQKIMSGTWKHDNLYFTPAAKVFSLGSWGPNVPAEVRQKTQKTFADLLSGKKNPMVGPIYDAHGKLKVKAGQKLSETFIYRDWNWYVQGVVTG